MSKDCLLSILIVQILATEWLQNLTSRQIMKTYFRSSKLYSRTHLALMKHRKLFELCEFLNYKSLLTGTKYRFEWFFESKEFKMYESWWTINISSFSFSKFIYKNLYTLGTLFTLYYLNIWIFIKIFNFYLLWVFNW